MEATVPHSPDLPVSPSGSGRDWIQTFTGRQFFPLRPTIGELSIIDIAHALAMKCRFTGHVSTFYSVAEHCVHCSFRVPREHALWALLHDAAEAYLPDVARPIKGRLWVGMESETSGLVTFARSEDEILRVVGRRFGLRWPLPECVHDVDLRMLATERHYLMKQTEHDWGELPPAYDLQESCGGPAELNADGTFKQIHLGWEWQVAKSWFLSRFEELTA